jgi:hypothetical protein
MRHPRASRSPTKRDDLACVTSRPWTPNVSSGCRGPSKKRAAGFWSRCVYPDIAGRAHREDFMSWLALETYPRNDARYPECMAFAEFKARSHLYDVLEELVADADACEDEGRLRDHVKTNAKVDVKFENIQWESSARVECARRCLTILRRELVSALTNQPSSSEESNDENDDDDDDATSRSI